MKYNKKTLWDFLNNRKIPQNITDYNFYKDAINISEDKDIYYICPIEVQSNYNFVLYLVDKFKDNKKFINEVAQNYLKNTPLDDYTYQELIFIMSDLVNEEDEYYILYQTKKDIIYNSKIKLVHEFLENDGSEDYGFGFLIVLINENSKVIADYIATKYVEKVFYDIVKYDLEEIIHMTYKDRFDFVTYGIDDFIIEFTAIFDGYLAYYLEKNKHLIKDIHQYLKKIAKNWKKYIKNNYSIKIDELNIAIQALMYKYDSSLSLEEIYKYIDEKSLLLPVKLSKEDDETNNILLDKKINIKDYKCLKESLDIAENIFMCGENKEKAEKKYKAKILDFKPNNKE